MTALAWISSILNYRPVLLSHQAPHINNLQFSATNKNLLIGPRWVLLHHIAQEWLVVMW
jgi:hypothetical protein